MIFHYQNKKHVLSNSESVWCNFSLLIAWRSSSSKCAVVYKISSKSDDFYEIWRYNDFQNGGRPPSWNCFTTIQDHPRSLCCWPQLPVKFHVNVIHRFEDMIAIWIFCIFGLKCLFSPQNGGFGGLWTHKCDYSLSRPQKAHPCVKPRLLSYQL